MIDDFGERGPASMADQLPPPSVVILACGPLNRLTEAIRDRQEEASESEKV
jgi:hypothetical protein